MYHVEALYQSIIADDVYEGSRVRLTEMKTSMIRTHVKVKCNNLALSCLIFLFWLGCLEVPQNGASSMDTGRASSDIGPPSADQGVEPLDRSVEQGGAHTVPIICPKSEAITVNVNFMTVADVRPSERFERLNTSSSAIGCEVTHHE